MDEQNPQAQQTDQARILTAPGLSQKGQPVMPDHRHNGFDVSRVFWSDLVSRKLYLEHTIQGTNAATAAFYGVFWIAPFACYVSEFREVHQTAGSDGSAVTVTLEKLTGTQAPDSGTAMLTTALSLKATANTVATGVLTPTTANLNLVRGDRLGLKDAGTLTAVANVTTVTEITII